MITWKADCGCEFTDDGQHWLNCSEWNASSNSVLAGVHATRAAWSASRNKAKAEQFAPTDDYDAEAPRYEALKQARKSLHNTLLTPEWLTMEKNPIIEVAKRFERYLKTGE